HWSAQYRKIFTGRAAPRSPAPCGLDLPCEDGGPPGGDGDDADGRDGSPGYGDGDGGDLPYSGATGCGCRAGGARGSPAATLALVALLMRRRRVSGTPGEPR
ncbi:MAG: hypothetical protein HYY06_27315, partial [Deltaproteobacteria bacterium]|nr:hypothetical protein [Deltaproteobacteria bacterium]